MFEKSKRQLSCLLILSIVKDYFDKIINVLNLYIKQKKHKKQNVYRRITTIFNRFYKGYTYYYSCTIYVMLSILFFFISYKYYFTYIF